jgi:signal peptidase I
MDFPLNGEIAKWRKKNKNKKTIEPLRGDIILANGEWRKALSSLFLSLFFILLQ